MRAVLVTPRQVIFTLCEQRSSLHAEGLKPHDFLSDLCYVNEFNQCRDSFLYNKRNKLPSCTSCVNSSLFLLL